MEVLSEDRVDLNRETSGVISELNVVATRDDVGMGARSDNRLYSSYIKFPCQRWIFSGEYSRANLGNSEHILNPCTDFPTGEDPIYCFRPLQQTLSMGLEAFSTPVTAHLAMAALSIS